MARNSAEDNNLDIIIIGNALISFVMELFFTIVGVALSSAICVATDKNGNNLTFSYHNFSLLKDYIQNSQIILLVVLEIQVSDVSHLEISDFVNADTIDEDNQIPADQDPLNDAIEGGNKFEGDILLTPLQIKIIKQINKTDLVELRSAIKTNHWPKRQKHVIIPYIITGNYSKKEKANIARAISDLETETCIR